MGLSSVFFSIYATRDARELWGRGRGLRTPYRLISHKVNQSGKSYLHGRLGVALGVDDPSFGNPLSVMMVTTSPMWSTG